jgi:hypothetical protein
VSTAERHWLFIAVAVVVALFALRMRARLRANYPDDRSKQMQSMLGFLRGIAWFAGAIAVIVLLDLARVALT